MPKVRLSLAVVLVAFLVGGLSLAQEKKDTLPAKTKGSLPANWKKLGLTDEQTQKVYKVRADYGDQINTLKQKITQLQSEEKAELLKLLTDAQKARLKEIATADIDKKPTDDKKPEVKKPEDKKP